MRLLFIAMLLTFIGCTKNIELEKEVQNKFYSFQDVWGQVNSDKLTKLPNETVSYKKLFKDGEDLILKDAKRTLTTHDDILEEFNKLAHPNGICFKGIWHIDRPNIYSGYFKQGSKALIIARASSALSNTKSGETRALGFAGKLFPTLNPNKVNKEHTANFFLIDDLGGTDTKYYKDISLVNEPPLSFTYSILKNMSYSIKVASTFNKADKNSGIRQLYEVSQLGESNPKTVITPKWLKIEMQNKKDIAIKDGIDFRDELKLLNDDELIFNIFVASKIIDNKKDWQKIGNITLDNSVVSKSCDRRLHFHHPRFLDELDYGLD